MNHRRSGTAWAIAAVAALSMLHAAAAVAAPTASGTAAPASPALPAPAKTPAPPAVPAPPPAAPAIAPAPAPASTTSPSASPAAPPASPASPAPPATSPAVAPGSGPAATAVPPPAEPTFVVPTPPAYPAAPAPYVAPSYPTPPGFHQHDGFFLRVAVGPAFLSDSGKAQRSATAMVPEATWKYTAKGAGVAFDVAVGGAISRNLILAGTLAVAAAPGANRKVTDTQPPSTPPDDASVRLGMSSFGVLVDGYPVESSGFHVGGILGFGDVNFDSGNADNRDQDTRRGFSIGGLVGYEWWVAADWGIGVMGRFTYVRGSRTSPDAMTPGATDTVTDGLVSPALLFTATYN